MEIYLEEAKLITPGTKEICRAFMNARYQKEGRAKFANHRIEVKLDSCGSVSIANSAFLTNIKTCKEYRIPSVSLKGIGGKTEPLTKAGILKHALPNGRIVRWLCYVFDIPVGHSKQLLLLSMSAIKLSNIDINFHIDESFEGRCSPLKFKDLIQSTSETHLRAETYHHKIDRGEQTPCDIYRNTTLYDKHENIVLMTEIQLKNIVESLGKDTVTGTDAMVTNSLLRMASELASSPRKQWKLDLTLEKN